MSLPVSPTLSAETHTDSCGTITVLIDAWTKGDKSSYDELFQLVYHELHHLALFSLRDERSHHFRPTALIHELYLRLADSGNLSFQNRHGFFAFAARVMRRIMVDAARARTAAKREGGHQVESEGLELLAARMPEPEQLIALDRVLERLKTLHPRKAQILEMSHFGGIDCCVISNFFQISERTVRRELKAAKQWASFEMKQ